MDARKRVLICSVLTKMQKDPEMSQRLGLKDTSYMKEKKKEYSNENLFCI